MGVRLLIDAVTEEEIRLNQQDDNDEYIDLQRNFLYDVFLDEEFLSNCLPENEIKLIQPNHGVVQFNPTSILTKEKRAIYLELLREVMRTNNSQNLDRFLYENRIYSEKLIDRVKSPKAVKTVIEKVEQWIQKEQHANQVFKEEFDQVFSFLDQRIMNNEKILIEFL